MVHADSPGATTSELAEETRRPFLIRFFAGAIGLIVGLVPLLAGGFAFLSPVLRKRDSSGQRVRVTSLAAVPDDGIPRRFPVIADRDDAWSHYPPGPIGSVYLKRDPGQEKPECFSATCPHLGCMVDYKPEAEQFKCPCHNSFFTVDGARIDPGHCPSPRDLDELDVELNGSDVYVLYQRFRGGVERKVAE